MVEALSAERLKTSAKVAARAGELNKAREVTAMAHCEGAAEGDAAGPTVTAVARLGGVIEVVDTRTGEVSATIAADKDGDRESRRIVGMKALWPAGAVPTIVSLTRGGVLRVHARGEDASDEWAQVSRAPTGLAECYCLDVGEDGETIRAAVGAKGAELRLWDVLKGEESARLRGGRAHRQTGLMDPAWTSAVAFVPGSACRRVVAGTGHYKLRVYDLDHGRRPRLEVAWDEARVTAVAPTPDGAYCWVANGRGAVSRMDLRTGAVSVVLKGVAGSVRALSIHPDLPLVASVGLDRHLRVHNTASLVPVVKMYLKNQMSGVAWASVSGEEAAAARAEVARIEEAARSEEEARRKEDDRKRKMDERDSDDEDGGGARRARVDDMGRGKYARRGGKRGRGKKR